MFSEPHRVEVDLAALDRNVRTFQRLAGSRRSLCAVVKADAYGLGAVPIARRLAMRGVDWLAVYSGRQAMELLAAGIRSRILILMPTDLDGADELLCRAVAEGRVQLTVHRTDQLRALDAHGEALGARVPVHVEVDTGITRGGMAPAEAEHVLRNRGGYPHVRLAGIFTHPACPAGDGTFTEAQFHRFARLLARRRGSIDRGARAHFAETFAALRDGRYHLDMLRIGLGLYGYGGDAVSEPEEAPPSLSPVVRWTSRVVHLHDVPPGTPVGYGGTFVTERRTRLALVPAGYGDGYPLALTNRGVVRVGPERTAAPVRGKVNMDQITVDVTDRPSTEVGTEVELIGADPQAPNALPRLAALAGGSSYEMLCRLSPRLPRHYVERMAPDPSSAPREAEPEGGQPVTQG